MTRRDIPTNELAEAYLSGLNIAQIANLFSCNEELVRYRLVSSGVHKPKSCKPARHGTRTMYTHYGCRCEACCRAEHAQYLKRKEAKKRKRVFSKWGDTVHTPSLVKRKEHNAKRLAWYRSCEHSLNRNIRWQDIYESYNGVCAICGCSVDPCDTWTNDKGRKCFGRNYPTVDHIVPLKLGGTDTFDNVQLLCKRCNSKKGARVEVSV